jgi:hypothetical protein
MACPSDRNNGFVQITDALTQSNLNKITNNDNPPCTIAFAPKSNIPTLDGNRIIEDNATDNTCTFKGNTFSLLDIQLCSVLHKGYLLPGQQDRPSAELILTFQAKTSNDNPYSGLLFSFPIYSSTKNSHSDYLTQLIRQSTPTCKYKNQTGSEYLGDSYQTLSNSSLSSCIQTCCNDTNCVAYNFKKGTCSLKRDTIPQLQKTNDTSMVSGMVSHNEINPVITSASCSIGTAQESNQTITKQIATLESIFFDFKNDTSQSCFSYKTCFEIVDKTKTISSKNLAIFIFPNGIHLNQSTFEQLQLLLEYQWTPYQVPKQIRQFEDTLRSYRFVDGVKTFDSDNLSPEGLVYTTMLSSCSKEFTNRFEYFTLPPRVPKSSKDSSSKLSTLSRTNQSNLPNEQSSVYKTNQYKCVPFDELTDLSGPYVIKGNKTMEQILDEKKKIETKQTQGDISSKSITTDQVETVVATIAGVAIVGMIFIRFGVWLSNHTNI